VPPPFTGGNHYFPAQSAAVALPPGYEDAWDREHVRLPCSPHARCVDRTPLWPVLCNALDPAPTDLGGLVTALRTIRTAVGGRWGLERIRDLVERVMSEGKHSIYRS